MDKIFVTKSSIPPFEEYAAEIKDIWTTHWLTNMGAKHNELQSMLKKFMGVEKLELLVNGHMALELTLQAMHLKGEVITTPFTFASTVHAIVRNGLRPMFCDIETDTYTIDANKIEALITDNTCAIMPVHVYGNVCDVHQIQKIADRYGLKVIYDAAHTFGEIYDDKSVASFGDASCLSFHATKVFNTIEGGAVVYNDSELGRKIYDLKNFGIHGLESVEAVGANAKMNEFAAAMGICNLRHFADEINKRRLAAEHYRERLSNVPGIKICEEQKHVKANYAYFPVVFEEKHFGATRNEVYEELQRHDVYARKYFYPLVNDFGCYDEYTSDDTPVARHIAKRVLTLPLYADLPLDCVDKICDIVLSCRKEV